VSEANGREAGFQVVALIRVHQRSSAAKTKKSTENTEKHEKNQLTQSHEVTEKVRFWGLTLKN